MVVPPYPQSSARAVVKFVRSLDREPRPTVAVKNGDDAIFETYLQHANVTGYYEREAQATWALFKSLCDNKQLKDATGMMAARSSSISRPKVSKAPASARRSDGSSPQSISPFGKVD